MNKLYWIVCEEGETTLFEGRFLGRTRGEAMKFLKSSLNRPTLNGTVFTITEMPVPLIREIVQELLEGRDPLSGVPLPEVRAREPEPDSRFDAYSEEQPPAEVQGPVVPPPGDPRPAIDWEAIREAYFSGLGPKTIVEQFGVSKSALNKKITREGWAAQRREMA